MLVDKELTASPSCGAFTLHAVNTKKVTFMLM
nr:MAG TPA: hypothetical protein [Caudoviricetes sp.]